MCCNIKHFCRPRQHPRYFCLSSCLISIFAALIILKFIITLNFSNIFAKRAPTVQSDITLVMDTQHDSFSDTAVTHTFALDTHQCANTYGAMVYSAVSMGSSYSITVEYQLPNTTHKHNCGSLLVDDYPKLLTCQIAPKYMPNGTIFTITLDQCGDTFLVCASSTSCAFLSVLPLSADTEYILHTSFDENDLFAIGISRFHYFKFKVTDINAFKLSLKDGDSVSLADCYGCIRYGRCIYIAPGNATFVDKNTAEYQTCNYSCHNEGSEEYVDGSYYLEELQVNVRKGIGEYWVNVYVDAGSANSADLNVYGIDLKLSVSSTWWYNTIVAAAGAVIFGLCCMWPAARYWWKGVGNAKYKNWKLNKQKEKYLKQWRMFHVNRYNLLMNLFKEKGVVDVIQCYLDDLEIIIELKDGRIFSRWYHHKFNVELKLPLLVQR
eukprot:58510_1